MYTHMHTMHHVSQGRDLTDEELIDYISEATTMSKGLEEYEGGSVVLCPFASLDHAAQCALFTSLDLFLALGHGKRMPPD